MENENNEIKLIKRLYFQKINRAAIVKFVLKTLLLFSFFLTAHLISSAQTHYYLNENIIPIAIIFILSLNIELFLAIKRIKFKSLAFQKFIDNNYVENEHFDIHVHKYEIRLNELENNNFYLYYMKFSEEIRVLFFYFRCYLYLVTFFILFNFFEKINSDIIGEPFLSLIIGTILFILILLAILLLILLIFLPLIIVVIFNKSYFNGLHYKYTTMINDIDIDENRKAKYSDDE